MPGDVSSRARALATQNQDITGGRAYQRITAWLRMQSALGPLNDAVQNENTPPSIELSEALYWFSVLTGLWGVEITEAIEAAVVKREMGMRRAVPKSLAPIPDEGGTMRDPATGKVADFEG